MRRLLGAIPREFWFFEKPHVEVVDGRQGNHVYTPDPDNNPDWPYLPKLRRYLGLEPLQHSPEE
ncbi:MAG TPA: hypothetical protein ENN79_12815 [Desulfobacteraceae bacterium]|nr:hypothetical protein [Desulfobacteraceae bacterium]